MILKWSRRVRWALISALVVYLAVCAYFWAIQRSKIYSPGAVLQSSPERLGMKYESLTIPSGSGEDKGMLYGWWIPAEQTDAQTIFFLHGNDKNIGAAQDLYRAGRLHSAGFNVLMIDYRGYGKSTGGEPSEAKLYEDAEAGWDHLIKKRGIDPKRCFIFGHSLGGAIGIELATHHPEAAGIIAESTFTSMADMGTMIYPYLPVELLLNQRFDTQDKVSHLKIPLLLIHGTWDKRIPFQMSQQLYERAAQPKSLKLIEGGEHNNDALIAPLEFVDIVGGFTWQYTLKTE